MGSNRYRVLVVDDEPNIADVVSMALRYQGFEVEAVGTGAEALAAVRTFDPDLMVLDIMLPDMEGFDVAERLGAPRARMPIVFLTARDATQDKIRGLTMGGDDYVTKPFSLEELVARIRAILRRAGIAEPESSLLTFGDLELDALGDPDLTAGRVLAHHRGSWLVATPERRLLPARGRLRDFQPATGDWVAVDAGGAIAHVLGRRGTIERLDAGATTTAQVLAANVDLALVVEPLPQPNERRVERLVALASAGGVEAALVLTKADLDPEADLMAARLARRTGLLEALAVSAPTGDGLGVLRRLLQPGATAVLLGPSGAGKSTLANALLGVERQATRPIRAADGRGRHTTVTRELLPLPNGALLIDTPGVRKVGLWDGTGSSFADVDELAAHCRFADCRHENEPGCAVRDEVDEERLAAWRKLQREQAWIDDRKAAARERGRLGRQRWVEQKVARKLTRRR